MPAESLEISAETAKRFMRRAQLLDTPAPDVASALGHIGYTQIDPINVCGRMHDLILRQRVDGYGEGALLNFIHSAHRPGFEHYLPGSTAVLVAYPLDSWKWIAPLIRSRRLRGGSYGKKLDRTHERLARRIIDEIAERGPLTSDDIEHEGRSLTGWGTPGRLVKNVLEILFVHGRVLISSRRNFRRVYDLPERVLPAGVLAEPEVPEIESRRWLALLKLRQRRLVALTRREIGLVGDAVIRVTVDDCPPLYCLRADTELLHTMKAGPAGADDPIRLLAPLDPLIYDRKITSALWGYDYTWEAYTPPERRRRGYFAMPLLAGTEIVGHVDPKADRNSGRLRVRSRSVRRGHAAAGAVRGLASFLGLK